MKTSLFHSMTKEKAYPVHIFRISKIQNKIQNQFITVRKKVSVNFPFKKLMMLLTFQQEGYVINTEPITFMEI